MMPVGGSTRFRRHVVHGVRVLLLAVIVGLMHWQQIRVSSQVTEPIGIEVRHIIGFFPHADSMGAAGEGNGTVPVLDADNEAIGYVLQTSPAGDHVIGFSGPTNVLLAFSPDDRIMGMDILSSGDTRDHVKQVLDDARFMSSLDGLTWEEAANKRDVDGVSGATLTSLAMREAIVHRLGGGPGSLRFPEPLTVANVNPLLPESLRSNTNRLKQEIDIPAWWHVVDAEGNELASILRTSPAADNVVGYQGPTDTHIAMDNNGKIIGIAIGKSYDNEPYVTYVREDEYFTTLFNGRSIQELAHLNLEEAEVEGVSGATMTSAAVAEGLVLAARRFHARPVESVSDDQHRWTMTAHDGGTLIVILSAVIIGMTRLRANRRLRVVLQLVVIGYLGWVAGNLISMAMVVGWAQHGVPWRSAAGLTSLLIAAVALPLTTRRNIYCSHLCPHGAAQQLLRRRLPWQLKLSASAKSTLVLIPPMLLAWCILVGMTSMGFSLVDIEPFDAYVFRIAGWPTIIVAVVGLVASLFIPMAYCRYGCPTGAMLEFLRTSAKSDRWTRRDWVALGLTALAGGLWLF